MLQAWRVVRCRTYIGTCRIDPSPLLQQRRIGVSGRVVDRVHDRQRKRRARQCKVQRARCEPPVLQRSPLQRAPLQRAPLQRAHSAEHAARGCVVRQGSPRGIWTPSTRAARRRPLQDTNKLTSQCSGTTDAIRRQPLQSEAPTAVGEHNARSGSRKASCRAYRSLSWNVLAAVLWSTAWYAGGAS